MVLLKAQGASRFWINGEPRAGDPYSHGFLKLPVALKKGTNAVLVQSGRGQLRIEQETPRASAQIEVADATMPDLVVGTPTDSWGAVVVVNATTGELRGLTLHIAGEGTMESIKTSDSPIPVLPPLSIRKVGFRLQGPAPASEGEVGVRIELRSGEKTLDGARVGLRAKPAVAVRRETFLSAMDGSVQYYGLVPCADSSNAAQPGLILTLHGAGVEGAGQAAVYAAKSWAHVVAPTNRRPFGFDWEDWGRQDALEVLELVQGKLHTDPRRTWLTGHSMGGHGTWHLGVTYPNRFAAIAPSAGWISMTSYAGARATEGDDPVANLLGRAALPSDTLALAPNLSGLGVYILHGDADDNVPVAQARRMRETLARFHPDFVYEERVGAGHWWGNECCDWPPLMDFLKRHEQAQPDSVRRVDFLTASPSVSATRDWATVEAQLKPFQISELHLAYSPQRRELKGTTSNVARLTLNPWMLRPEGDLKVVLDGVEIDVPRTLFGSSAAKVWFHRGRSGWSRVEASSPGLKQPVRQGPFKEVFRDRMLFVHGTIGTAEETHWNLAKARVDAERFYYQGNGSVDVVSDTAFDPTAEPDRNVILYGHAESNAAWKPLLGSSPVQVARGKATVGDRIIEGVDLACLFIRPRPGSSRASVGVVGGTGLPGLRLSDCLPYFTSGVAYPDLVLVRDLSTEPAGDAILCAGFFGEDWSIESGEFAWREK